MLLSERVRKFRIEKITKTNNRYRKILYTTKQMQLIVQKLNFHQKVDKEKHPLSTQFIRIESGKLKVTIFNKSGMKKFRTFYLNDGDSVVIPANTFHELESIDTRTTLYTLYAKPVH